MRKIKVDKSSANKIINIIESESDGILAGNSMYNQGVRAIKLIERIEEKIEKINSKPRASPKKARSHNYCKKKGSQ